MTRSSTGRRKWRLSSKLYLLGTFIVVSSLLYWEQSALLYVISTVAVCAIMLVVAFSKLEDKKTEQDQATEVERTGNVPGAAFEPQRKRA